MGWIHANERSQFTRMMAAPWPADRNLWRSADESGFRKLGFSIDSTKFELGFDMCPGCSGIVVGELVGVRACDGSVASGNT